MGTRRFGVALLFIGFLGHVGHLLFQIEGNYSGIVRLAYMAAYPILLTLPQLSAFPLFQSFKVKTPLFLSQRLRFKFFFHFFFLFHIHKISIFFVESFLRLSGGYVDSIEELPIKRMLFKFKNYDSLTKKVCFEKEHRNLSSIF